MESQQTQTFFPRCWEMLPCYTNEQQGETSYSNEQPNDTGKWQSRFLNVRLEDAGDVSLLEQTFLSEFCRSTFHFNEQHVL